MCRGAGTRVESLNFVGCSNSSAVVVELLDGVTSSSPLVSFSSANFSENVNPGEGGALRAIQCGRLFCASPLINIENCTFSKNRARKGAAVYAENVHLSITNSRFTENRADHAGGAISFKSERRELNDLTITNSTFDDNLAASHLVLAEGDDPSEDLAGEGGAVEAINPRRIVVQDARFVNNTSCVGGGALYVCMIEAAEQQNASSFFRIERSVFEQNGAYCSATPRAEIRNPRDDHYCGGGALFYRSTVYLPMNWTISDTRFARNRAVYGGAMSLSGQPETPLTLADSLLEENEAVQRGGAIYIVGAQVRMHGMTLSRNSALVGGGGIGVLIGGRLITQPHPTNHSSISIIEGNTAYYGGGIGVYVSGLFQIRHHILHFCFLTQACWI